MNHDEIKSFPSHILFDIARNDQAQYDARLIAIEELIDRDDHRALHPDLALLAREVFAKRESRVDLIEFPVPTITVHAEPPSVFTASVTTDTLMQSEQMIDEGSPVINPKAVRSVR